jgi:oxalate decarboxylase
MASEFQQSPQPVSTPSETDQILASDTSNYPRRSFLKVATATAAALRPVSKLAVPATVAIATSGAVSATIPCAAAAHSASPKSLKYDLEQAEPLRYAGGTSRIVTSANIAKLSGLSMASLHIDPGAMQELHWHTNANELNYCLSGQGEIGIFVSGSQASLFTIQSGSTSFVPMGAAHYIRNTGLEVLHLITGFSNEQPEHISFSNSLGDIPRNLLAQNFELPTQSFPVLPQQHEQFLVKVGQVSPTGASSSSPYTVNIKDIPRATYDGGFLITVSPQFIAALDEIALIYLQGKPGVLREPHWHPNVAELGYYAQGSAQIEVIAPNEQRETFVVQPGNVAFIPMNHFHYIDSISNDPLTALFFFSNSKPSHIDLSQVMNAFPHEVIAASFGSNLRVFDNIPNLGDVTIVSKRT